MAIILPPVVVNCWVLWIETKGFRIAFWRWIPIVHVQDPRFVAVCQSDERGIDNLFVHSELCVSHNYSQEKVIAGVMEWKDHEAISRKGRVPELPQYLLNVPRTHSLT